MNTTIKKLALLSLFTLPTSVMAGELSQGGIKLC